MSQTMSGSRRASAYLAFVGVIAIVVATTTCKAVEITGFTRITAQGVNGKSASAWSPDGTRILLAEHNETDQRIHLCIYSVSTRTKEKCIYFLQPQPDLGVDSIDWADTLIYVAVGFGEGATVIQSLLIPDWNKPSFRERNLEDFKPLPEAYGSPAWDKWERGLFYTGEDERSGIQFLPNGGKPRKYASGINPAVTRHYLWFTALDKDLMMDGIGRIAKASHEQVKLTRGHVDVSVSPRQDEKAALFIRKENGTNKSALYAYIDGVGEVGPLISGDHRKDEELISIKLSPNGKYALLTSSYANESDKLKIIVDLKLLSVHW